MHIDDLQQLTVGFIYDLFIESSIDDEPVKYKVSQNDIDLFLQ